MAKDIDLMAKNAKTYNEPGSQVFKVNLFPLLFFCQKNRCLKMSSSQDANTIKKVFIQRKTDLEHAEPTKSSLRIRYFVSDRSKS